MGSEDPKYVSLDEKWAPRSVSENALLPLYVQSPPDLIERETVGQNYNSVCQRYTPSLSLGSSEGLICRSQNGQNREKISGENLGCCSTSAKPLIKCFPEKPKEHAHAMSNWDLNIAKNISDSSLDGPVIQCGQIHELDLGVIQKEGIESCPARGLNKEITGTDVELEEHGAYKRDFYCRLSNKFVPAARLDSDINLDLQLKLPSRPEVSFYWRDDGTVDCSEEKYSIIEMTKLSLALTENPNLLKSEPYEKGYLAGINKIELHSLKSLHINSTNSEPIEGDFKVETKLEPQEGSSQVNRQEILWNLKEECLPMKSDRGNLTYCNEASKDSCKTLLLDLNSFPVDYDGGLCHDGPGVHFEANIGTDASILIDADKMAGKDVTSRAHRNGSRQSGEMDSESAPRNSNQIMNEALCDLAADGLGECVISHCEHRVVYSEPAAGDDSNMAKFVEKDARMENNISLPVEIDGVEVDVHINTLEQGVSAEDGESLNSHEVGSTRDVSLEKRGDDGHLEDGKVKDLTKVFVSDKPTESNGMEMDMSIDTPEEVCNKKDESDDCNIAISAREFSIERRGSTKDVSLEKRGDDGHLEDDEVRDLTEVFVSDKPSGSDGMEMDMSIDTLDEVCNKKDESDDCNEANSVRDFSIDWRDWIGSLEDGEVRDLMPLHRAEDGPIKQLVNQVLSEESGSVMGHVGGTSTAMPYHVGKNFQMRDSHERNTRYDDCSSIATSYRGKDMSLNVHDSSVPGLLPTGSSKIWHVRRFKNTPKTRRNKHFNKTKGDYSVHRMTKSYKKDFGMTVPDGSLSGLGRERESGTSAKTGLPSVAQEMKYGGSRGCCPSYNNLSSTKKKHSPMRPILSHDERNRLGRKSFERQQSHTRSREKQCFQSSECERSHGRTAQEHDANSTLMRKSDDWSGAVQCDTSSVPNHVLQQPDNPTTSWAPWPEVHKVGTNVASYHQFGSAGMVTREPMKTEHLSRFTPNKTPVTENSAWNVSPNRWHEREVSDFHETHKVRPIRISPAIMMDPCKQAQMQPRHEHAGNASIVRQRNLSPIQSRQSTIFGAAGWEGSSRPRQCVPNHRLQSRKSSGGYSDNCRLPHTRGHDRMQSAHQHPRSAAAAAAAMASKRVTSHVSRFCNGERDLGPSRSHMIINVASEDHFGPTNDYYYDRTVAAEYSDSRCGEKQHGSASRHHLYDSEGSEASQPMAFCGGVDQEFYDGGRPRSLDRYIKSRIGNHPGQNTDLVPEEGYRYLPNANSNNGNEAGQPITLCAGVDKEFPNGSIDRSVKTRLGNRLAQNTDVMHRERWQNGNTNNGRRKKRRFNR